MFSGCRADNVERYHGSGGINDYGIHHTNHVFVHVPAISEEELQMSHVDLPQRNAVALCQRQSYFVHAVIQCPAETDTKKNLPQCSEKENSMNIMDTLCSLSEAQDGLLLVVGVRAEPLDVHAAAQALQHLRLGEVCQTLVVNVQLVDQPLQLLRPARIRRHVLRDQANQLLRVSLGTNRAIPGRHA